MDLFNKPASGNPIQIDYTDAQAESTLANALHQHLATRDQRRPLIILCIGTDRSTGDALGPFVGTQLREQNQDFYVFGTLETPVHAVNLKDTIQHIEYSFVHPYIIAVDACLGQTSSVGKIQFAQGPLKPGAGVNKKLPEVGDVHITGIVNVGGFMEYFVLQNTRLQLVISMARVIASSIEQSISSHINHELIQTEKTSATLTSRLWSQMFRNA
ncbi:spore protease YyaC [Ferroacidibacillus organovorans]|uniref:Sporulation protein n=1 Tax=Ferroacidibacillus organovorans TaxID=1765683 RepID=A0A853KB17_9BACL|nr:spore protease YyaC [Ferroacidibacillus organovorans]KYP80772.1 sporulation protein [Ferroacidibacillus organovorans]OAG93554.1 sporulation protein [Ferroacidibacillus organovorans]